MGELTFISDYKKNDSYRRSFSQLACATFGLDFESWYQYGFWDDQYICHSYVDEGQVVANVSTLQTQLIINNERKEAVQLVTGITHSAYRKQGLMGALARRLVHLYEKQSDCLYVLLDNKLLMPFWRELGFVASQQKQFFLPGNVWREQRRTRRMAYQKLDLHQFDDRQLLFALASRSRPGASSLYLDNTHHIALLYGLNTFKDDIYFFPEKQVILFCRQEEEILHIYDLFCYQESCLPDILNSIIQNRSREIIFHFTPAFGDLPIQSRDSEPESIFAVRPALEIKGDFTYPAIG